MAGAGDAEDDYSIFEVRVACTPAGMEKWAEVVSHVFTAIRAMKKGLGNATEAARIGKMIRHVDELNFDYKEEEEASGYTSDLAGNLHQYNATDALRGPAVTSAFNATRLTGLLARMTPQRLLLLRADFTQNLTKPQKEKWYGTEYAELALPAGSLEEWSYPASDSSLALPEENQFLPSDFKLLAQPKRADAAAGAAEPPLLLFNRSSGTLWHRTETSFGLPMATMQLSWAVPRVGRSPRGAVLAQMLELCVREQLRDVSYDAGVAGSAVALGSSTSGFELSAYGYSQRLETLLLTMLDNVRRVGSSHTLCTPYPLHPAPLAHCTHP